jgi:hypothetical protein
MPRRWGMKWPGRVGITGSHHGAIGQGDHGAEISKGLHEGEAKLASVTRCRVRRRGADVAGVLA